MTDEQQTPAPPVGEEVHLPGPSAIPLFTALGVTFLVIGTTTTIVFVVLGAIILVVCVARWIADTRRDISELPLEHSGH